MTDLPNEIMVWRSMEKLTHIGTWATERYPEEAVAYVPLADAQAAQAAVITARDMMGEFWSKEKARAEAAEAERDRLAAANAVLEAKVARLTSLLERAVVRVPPAFHSLRAEIRAALAEVQARDEKMTN